MSIESSLSDQHSHTLVEILSQPKTWRSSLRRLHSDSAFEGVKGRLAGRKSWLFTGCGTSFYLAEAAAASWTLLTGQTARALPSSEILLFPQLYPLSDPELQAVVISRSGSTSEAVRAAEELRNRHKVATWGITCSTGSELAKACDFVVELPDADEKSVVMTRSFSTMLLALQLLAAETGSGTLQPDMFEQVAGCLDSRLPGWNRDIERFVATHSFEDFIYLAQGPFFPIGREASLKVTEMSHSYAQSYHTLEFRHGPKAIVGPQTCIGFFLSDTGAAVESEVLREMKDLGGRIIAICNGASDAIRRFSDLVLEFNAPVPEVALLAPFVAPAQLLGYHVGVKKGFNPDKPKNLSRVVILD